MACSPLLLLRSSIASAHSGARAQKGPHASAADILLIERKLVLTFVPSVSDDYTVLTGDSDEFQMAVI